MDNLYIPELTIQLIEKDISDAIYELQIESKKTLNSIDELITTTKLLKSGWKTSEGIISTDKINNLTTSLRAIAKEIIANSDNISTNITHQILKK